MLQHKITNKWQIWWFFLYFPFIFWLLHWSIQFSIWVLLSFTCSFQDCGLQTPVYVTGSLLIVGGLLPNTFVGLLPNTFSCTVLVLLCLCPLWKNWNIVISEFTLFYWSFKFLLIFLCGPFLLKGKLIS